jgi:hypothetical protein
MEAAAPHELSLEVGSSWHFDWAVEAAWTEPAKIGRALSELGVQPDRVQAVVADYAAEKKALAARPAFIPGAEYHAHSDPDEYAAILDEKACSDHASLTQRLRDLLGRQTFRVREETRIRIELPLFLLAAPPVPGSLVSYETTETSTIGRGWKVTVMGTGTGRTARTELADMGRFSAGDGQRKLVFLPATLLATAIDVLERGRKVGEGCRTEVLFAEGRVRHNQAVRLLASDADPPGPFTELEVDSFELERAGSDLTNYTRAMAGERSGSVELGVAAYGARIGVEAYITRNRGYALTHTLPGGWRYECARITGPHVADGIRWSVDR